MAAIARKVFFDAIRPNPFRGSLSGPAVAAMDALLDEWERRGLTDLRWLAYMLATVLAECGRNMSPVREGFKDADAQARAYVAGRGYAYARVINGRVYYGRGLVQLTWLSNYEKMANALGLPLVTNPDLALELAHAIAILFEGMLKAETTVGDFTGKSLEMYFNDRTEDPVGARRIINGTDRAEEIAGYYRLFLKALRLAVSGTVTVSLPPAIVVPKIKVPDPGKPGAVKQLEPTFWGRVTALFKPKGV